MIITVNTFGGVSPKIADRLLPDSAATVAENCDLKNGNLCAFKDISNQRTVQAGTQSIHRFHEDTWLQWQSDVDCLRGPLPNDTENRTYFTGDGAPKVTYVGLVAAGAEPYPSNSYLLGVPAPDQAPTPTPSGASSNADAVATSRVYIYTYVTEKGEEGPPSPPSVVVDWLPGQSVEVSQMSSVPTGNYNVTKKRIYRYAQGASSGNYFFVAEVDDAATAFTDTIDDVDLPGGMLETTDYDPPPEDMHSLTMLANGMMAGASGREVCFCEPYLPYAWPVKYRVTVDYDIVGLGSIGNGVVVLTEGQPYIIQGSHPSTMGQQKVDSDQACMSKRSVADNGGGVVFASPDGLQMVTASGTQNVTESLFTQKQWQALKPETILGVFHEEAYIGFYDDGTHQGSFILDPKNPNASLIFTTIHADAVYRDLLTDTLYLVQDDQLVAWDGDSVMDYRWRSKMFVTARPINLSAIRVMSDGPVEVNVWADDVLRWTATAFPDQPARLPSGYLAHRWEFELSGTAEVERVDLATAVSEIN